MSKPTPSQVSRNKPHFIQDTGIWTLEQNFMLKRRRIKEGFHALAHRGW
jgi:hypothetical protein